MVLGLTLFTCAAALTSGAVILLIGYNVLKKGYFKAVEPNPKIMIGEMVLGGIMILGAIATVVVSCLK